MELSPADLSRIRDLYTQGHYRQALAIGERTGPIRTWSGPAARLLGGRLAIQLGGPRLGRRLHLVAFRQSPAYLEAVYYHARYRLEHFGPYSAWQFFRDHTDWSDAPPELRADWTAIQALTLARLRDFDRAEKLLTQANELCPNRPWVLVERSSVLELADRPDEAMAAARKSLELHPWFRPGVQAVAHLLHRRGRDEEAVTFLHEAAEHLESGIVLAQLAALQLDLDRPTEARASLDRYGELTPLMEPEVAKWLAARRADAAYRLGETDVAIEQARRVGEDFYTAFADRLSSGGSAKRTILPVDVGYDRTPPSAYELIGRFWKQPVPSASNDTPPSLDGLPDAAERRRFDDAGWTTREFCLTTEAAQAAIAAGVPFLLTLVETGFGQSRLVVGADPIRGSLFLADGLERRSAEAPIAVLVDRYKPFGPRCLALVPPNSGVPLNDLELPDAAVYDQLHGVQVALIDRDFPTAKDRVAALQAAYPEHRLAKFAAIAWARATGHPVLLLKAIDALRPEFPDDSTLTLSKAAVLRDLGRVPERLDVLQIASDRAEPEPLILQSLAQMLLADPDEQDEADRLLRRSLRTRPQAAAGYYLLATQLWENQQFAEAVEVYRFAVCADDREEQFAEAYSKAARAAGQGTEPLRLFQQKAGKAAVPQPPSVKALCQTLWDRDEPDQAFAALGTAIDKLGTVEPASPGYVDLLLFRVELQTQFGRFDAAEADLTVARSVAPKAVWLRAAAKFARSKPDFAEALAYLRELADLEPLAVETHRQIVALLADVESRAVARDYLDRLVARFPDVYPLLKLRVEFLYQDPDDAAETATRQLIELCPDDAWASRQLALILADHKQHEAAFLAANWAAVSEPDHPSHYAVLAHLHRRAERTDEATAALRAGLEAYPDHELAVIELVELGRGLQEKLNALKFISDRLHASPHTGDGLLAYFDRSIRVFEEFGRAVDPEEHDKFEADLEQFLDERPDLWQTWSLVIQHLAMSQRTEEALTLAREATEQFPLVAKVWLDLAQVYRVLDRDDDRLEALRQALQVAPGWVPVARELAEALSEADRDEESVQVLDAAVARAPHDALAHWIYAERLWAVGQSRPALDRAKRAVRLDPGIDPRLDTAWTAVMVWTDRLDVPEEALELARELTTARPGDPRAWLRLARCLGDNRQSDEALAALAKAVTLDPRNVEAHDMRAERLAAMGRFDEALAAAKPRELVAELPLVLQGRAAWIEARRGNYAAAIPPMQALVAVDPDYIWGWQQLAEWYNDTNRPENYLEAASELARLRPDHPMSLTMRGEARLQTGDRDAGKHDLRDALRVHPGYSPAAVLLFDACLADGETREARTALAVLQEHLTGPEVLVKQLQFAARTDDADGAARAFAEICQTPGDGPPLFLQMAASEMQSSGWGETAAAVMRAAWETGDEFNPWAGIFWLDTPDAEAAELATRLNACDRVLVATPGFVPALDRRAELLAHDGRIEEALATCIPSADGPVPIALRGRVAWIEAHRGDRAKAIAIMKQVVAEEPDYGWGWRQLTQWYDAADRTRECLDAADHLVRLSPDDPVTRVIRGEARRVLGDQTGARDDFQRAFDQDPSFQAAGLQLIAAQLSTDDVSAAAETLEILRDNGNGPLVILRSIQVAARQGDLAAARSAFHDLTREIQATRGVLRDAIAALAAAGWEAEADEELTASGEDPAGTPAAAGLWVERAVAADQPWRAADRLNALTERNRDAGREAVLAYAWAMATTDRPDAAASTIQRSAELLRDDDDAWAKAGATLTEARNYALAAAWLSDWKDRAGQRPWMLRPLIDSLRALDRDAEAEVVARDAVERNADETPADFRAWLAVIAAVQGETAVAAEQLKAIDALGLADGTKLWLAFAEALVMVQQAGPAGKKLAFAEAKDHLRTAAAACAVKDVPPGAARWFKKVVDRLALDAASLPARAWSWWQKVNPWVKEQ